MKAKCESMRVAKTAKGKKHSCVRFTLNCSIKGQVFIDMKDCVEDMIKKFKNKIIFRIKNPVNDKLFEVCESKLLSKERKKEFYIMIAKALFLTERARSDIECVVTFSSTRVFKPDEED